MTHTFYWYGKTESVNRWHGARAIRRGPKWIAMIFENPKYKKFKESLVSVFENTVHFSGYVDMTIVSCLGKRNDTGNIEKPIGDSLEKAGVIDNDKYIRNIYMIRKYHPVSGTKNKFNDSLQIRISSILQKESLVLEAQQKYDHFELRIK